MLAGRPALKDDWRSWRRGWQASSHPLISGCMTGFSLGAGEVATDLQGYIQKIFTSDNIEDGRLWMEGLLQSGRQAVLYNKTFWALLRDVTDDLQASKRARISLRRALALLTPAELAPLGFVSEEPPQFRTLTETAEWLREARAQFSADEMRVLQQDALANPDFSRHLTHPRVMEHLVPDGAVAAKLLARPVAPKSLPAARRLLDCWIGQILPALDKIIRSDSTLNPGQKRANKNTRLDLRRTVRHNIRLYDAETGRLRIAKPFFIKPRETGPREIYLLIDRSGSMAENSLYGALLGVCLSRLAISRVRLFAFADDVRELRPDSSDPTELLLSLPHGGGTDISGALRFVRNEIEAPARAHVILVSDMLDGGDPKLLLDTMDEMRQDGLRLTALASLTP